MDLDRTDLVVCIGRYQNELPKKIKSRGKDAHLNHEELVQTMKWKQIVSRFFLVWTLAPSVKPCQVYSNTALSRVLIKRILLTALMALEDDARSRVNNDVKYDRYLFYNWYIRLGRKGYCSL